MNSQSISGLTHSQTRFGCFKHANEMTKHEKEKAKRIAKSDWYVSDIDRVLLQDLKDNLANTPSGTPSVDMYKIAITQFIQNGIEHARNRLHAKKVGFEKELITDNKKLTDAILQNASAIEQKAHDMLPGIFPSHDTVAS